MDLHFIERPHKIPKIAKFNIFIIELYFQFYFPPSNEYICPATRAGDDGILWMLGGSPCFPRVGCISGINVSNKVSSSAVSWSQVFPVVPVKYYQSRTGYLLPFFYHHLKMTHLRGTSRCRWYCYSSALTTSVYYQPAGGSLSQPAWMNYFSYPALQETS